MLKSILYLFLITLVGAAATTPFVFQLIQGLSWSGGVPFSRVFDRVAMLWVIIALICLRQNFEAGRLFILMRRILKVRSELVNLIAGLAVSLVVGLSSLFLLAQANVLTLEKVDLADLGLKILRTLPAALLIGLLEESFFRVVFFDGVLRRFKVVSAALITSLVFAVVHFIAPKKQFAVDSFSFLSGFDYLITVMTAMLDVNYLGPALGLMLASLLLCYAIRTFESLYLIVGIHAGWVLAMKIAAQWGILDVPLTGLARRYFLVGQPLTWLGLGLMFALLYFIEKKKLITK